jgi:hypothetical protein
VKRPQALLFGRAAAAEQQAGVLRVVRRLHEQFAERRMRDVIFLLAEDDLGVTGTSISRGRVPWLVMDRRRTSRSSSGDTAICNWVSKSPSRRVNVHLSRSNATAYSSGSRPGNGR